MSTNRKHFYNRYNTRSSRRKNHHPRLKDSHFKDKPPAAAAAAVPGDLYNCLEATTKEWETNEDKPPSMLKRRLEAFKITNRFLPLTWNYNPVTLPRVDELHGTLISLDDDDDDDEEEEEEEEELRRKIKHLEAELSSSTHLHQQLQRKVRFLEDDNYLLQTKQKQLTDTITTILEAKQSFLNAYQESTCELKRSIESKDKKISMLYEKINSHLLSIDSIRKEAYFVNQIVDNAQSVVNEKEEIGARLKIQMDKVCAFEKLFIEKISDLETKLKSNEIEFQRKDRVIAELQAQLEMRKITDQCQLKIEDLQETVQVKEGIIQTLISENKALRSELGMLEVTLKAIQDTMSRMDEEDRVSFSLILANQEKDATGKDQEDDRIYHDIQHCEASSHQETSRGSVDKTEASPSFKVNDHIAGPLMKNTNVNSCVSESASPPPSSVQSQLAANASNALAVEEKDDCNTYIQQLDSECSTTQA